MAMMEDREFLADVGLSETLHWEVCFAEEGKEESVLEEKKKTCKKCQGKDNYIAVKDLSLDLLPPNCRKEISLEYINHIAELTVKISIAYRRTPTSNTTWTTTGTGFVVALTNVEQGEGEHLDQKTEISIFTAEHVINSSAVKTIEIIFFFENSRDPKRTRTLYVDIRNISTDLQKDFCQLSCFSSDPEFVRQLNHHLERVREISKCNPSATNFSFIVSHPHGLEKQVSFGSWWQDNVERDDHYYPHKLTRLGDSLYGVYKNTTLYDIPTCGGSSGARVMLFGHQAYEYTYHLGCPGGQIGVSAYSLKKIKLQEETRQPFDFDSTGFSENLL